MEAGGQIRQREIELLLSCLMDAETRESRQIVLERLLPILPFGHHPGRYIEHLADAPLRASLRQHYLRFLNELKLRSDLKALIQRGNGDMDLEAGAALISRLSDDMDVTPQALSRALDDLARPLKGILLAVPADDHERRVESFRHYLFEEQGFRGNTENYYEPANSFLSELLRTHLGIPVSLSVLALLVGWRAGLPLFGVNLPGHFIVKYSVADYTIFLDAFNEGNLLTAQDCLNFLVRQGLEPSAAYLVRTGNLTIIKRMYRNLINYHSSSGDRRMERILRQHFNILEDCSIRS